MDERTSTPELRLDDLRWLQGLARRLVRDPGLADDAVQETVLKALTSRRPAATTRVGEAPHRLRAWLATVLRNTLRQEQRGDARRRNRETLRAAGSDATAPSTLEIVEELALHRRLVEVVNELAEPYRTTIVLRFLRGRSPREISRELDLPVKTVHTRIERALAQLRQKLDREYGTRATWVAFCLPLVKPRTGALGLGAGVLAIPMSLKWLVLAAGLAAVGAWIAIPKGSVATTPAVAVPEVSASRSEDLLAAVGPEAPEASARARTGVPQPATQEATQGAIEEARRGAAPLLRGSVRDLDGQPIASIDVVFEREQGSAFVREGEPAGARTDVDGAFEMTLPPVRGRLTVVSPHLASVHRPYLDGFLPPESPIVVVAPNRSYAGRAVDSAGRPVAGATVQIALGGEWLQASALPGADGRTVHLADPVAERETDEHGEFRFEDVGYVAGARLAAERDGFEGVELELPAESRFDLELVLGESEPVVDERILHGLVLDADGLPVADALVARGWDAVRTDPAGRFALELEEWQDGGTLRAVRRGFAPASLELSDVRGGRSPADPLVLELGGAPARIRGRVVDAEGEPVSGVAVWTPDSTYFGRAAYRRGDRSILGETTVEALVQGLEGGSGPNRTVDARSDANGEFLLEGLLARDYAVFALDPATLAQADPVVVRAGGQERDVVLRLEGGVRRRVAGRVLSRHGQPLAGVHVSLGRTIGWENPPPPRTNSWDQSVMQPPGHGRSFHEESGVVTDADGRFELPPLHVERARLLLTGHAIVLAENIALDPAEDLEHLEIRVEASSRCRVVLVDPAEADGFGVVGPAGDLVPLYVQVESHRLSTPAVDIVDGRSGVVQLPEGTHTFVLRRGEQEVRRVVVELEPGGVQDLRF